MFDDYVHSLVVFATLSHQGDFIMLFTGVPEHLIFQALTSILM